MGVWFRQVSAGDASLKAQHLGTISMGMSQGRRGLRVALRSFNGRSTGGCTESSMESRRVS